MRSRRLALLLLAVAGIAVAAVAQFIWQGDIAVVQYTVLAPVVTPGAQIAIDLGGLSSLACYTFTYQPGQYATTLEVKNIGSFDMILTASDGGGFYLWSIYVNIYDEAGNLIATIELNESSPMAYLATLPGNTVYTIEVIGVDVCTKLVTSDFQGSLVLTVSVSPPTIE